MFRRHVLRSLSSLFIVVVLVSSAIAKGPDLRIGIMGDQTGTYDLDQSYAIMQNAADRFAEQDFDVIIHVGDLVESITGITDSASYADRFQRARSIMDGIGTDWYMAAGDHDVNPPKFKPMSEDRSRERWFKALMADAGYPVADKLYYSVDVEGYHFIFLYSLENLHTDPRWGNVFQNRISTEQFDWLKSDLEQNRKARGIVVVVHHPMWYTWMNWAPIHQLLREYPVALVVAGHFHYDQDEGELDGIRYIVMGSTGGVVKDCDAASGGAQEYGILELKKGKVQSITLHEVETDSILELTPRHSMDRIQAISSMISNAWMDESLGLVGGQVVNTADNQPANRFDLESLGNPIDLPLSLMVTSDSPLLQNPMWNMGETIPATAPITVKAGYNVDFANTSRVGQWFPYTPLWAAEIVGADSNATSIGIRIEASFTDTRTRSLRSQIAYPLRTQ